MEDLHLTFGLIAAVTVLGFIAGTFGGLLGTGGSIIMIPGLVLLFGQGRAGTEHLNQHVYQAAAMVANVAVAVPAALRHRKAGAMTPVVIRWMLPAALVFVLVGVTVSNLFEGRIGAVWLGRVLAMLLVYVVIVNVRRLIVRMKRPRDPNQPTKATAPRSTVVGAAMGSIAGLLGVGGGAIAVPTQQLLMKLPLRSCIANSAAVMCVSATIGAIYKNATLGQHGCDWRLSLTLALLLAPTCFAGGRLGAVLTHRLPVQAVRVAFIAMLIAAAYKLAAIPWDQL